VAASSPAAGGSRARRLAFALWLGVFYAAWLAWMTGHDAWSEVRAHWPTALTMLFGSYVAGSTPMGGGSVAFPILVFLLREPAALGRDFALAIQSLGMSSAVLYGVAVGRPLAWGVLRWALLGSALATPIGVLSLAPFVSELGVKLVYAVVWAAFGGLTLRHLAPLAAQSGMLERSPGRTRLAGLLVGAIGGGGLASVAGVGADMLLYCALVLGFRADARIAIPSAVALMAFTSLVAVATRAFAAALDPAAAFVAPGLAAHWLAAAPVVVIGAPLGALAVGVIPRRATLVLVSLLCLAQLAWVCLQAQLSLGAIALVVAAAVALAALLEVSSEFSAAPAARRGSSGLL
jgi:uncharacterized membrane protein YfcA